MRTLAVVLVSLLLIPTAVATPWLQHGGDAARTMYTPDPGPAFPDRALRVSLPGDRPDGAPPLLIDEHAYVLTRQRFAEHERTSALWRLSLVDGSVTMLADLNEHGPWPNALASDGERLFVVTGPSVHAYALTPGPARWEYPIPEVSHGPVLTNWCAPPTVGVGVLIIACRQLSVGRDVRVPLPTFPWDEEGAAVIHETTIVAALDPASGAERWTWQANTDEDPLASSDASPPGFWAPYLQFVGATLLGDQVIVHHPSAQAPRTEGCRASNYITEAWGSQVPGGPILRSLDVETGATRWTWTHLDYPAPNRLSGEAPGLGYVDYAQEPYGYLVTGNTERLLVLSDLLEVLEAEDACFERSVGTQTPDDGTYTDRAMAYDGQSVFMRTSARWVRYDLEGASTLWSQPTDDYRLRPGQVVLTPATLFAADSGGTMMAISTEDGQERWRARLTVQDGDQRDYHRLLMAVSDEALVAVSDSGNVTVLGRIPAGIEPVARTSTSRPAPGELVTLDLSGSRPGVLSEDVELRIEWGDGSASDWSHEAVHEHVYDEQGRYVATVFARNAADQGARELVTFDVAERPTGLAALATPAGAGVGLGVALLVVLVALGAVIVTRRRDTAVLATMTAPPPDRLAVYRAALEDALDEQGAVLDEREAGLAELRARLGLTDRDHGVLLESLRHDGDTRVISPAMLKAGTTFLGKYRIEGTLGDGGQGTALLATDTELERKVVVKLLHPGHADPEALLREARSMAMVRHRNVVTVYEVARLGATVFLVLDHAEGGNLQQRIENDGPLDRERFVGLARDLLGALGAVHRAGLVHRDVKPSNVLLDGEGRAVLADFGVVHVPGLEATMAAFRTMEAAVGTIPYMSPEQARGRAVDATSDLCSAALVLYEAATGNRLWTQGRWESPVELQMRIASAGGFNGELPAWAEPLGAWFERALHPDPGERFADAEAMADALTDALADPRDLT